MTATAAAPTLAPSPAAAMVGFAAHLRANGFAVGPGETADALAVVERIGVDDALAVRLGLKTLIACEREEWERFDALFEAYWSRRGRVRHRARETAQSHTTAGSAPAIWDRVLPRTAMGASATGFGDDGADDAASGIDRIAASGREALARTDLRQLVDPDAIAAAERLAERLARAIVHRLSRRRRAASRGAALDLRRMIRASLGHGGEPIERVFRVRPDRPVRIVALVDVSGSMRTYARFFLFFVRGLIARWLNADAYLFHTRLARITGAFSDPDPLKAMGRLSLMADGFGGGTRIARSLKTFNDRHAKFAIDRRTVVIIMSDGYDTDPPAALADELARLKRRARRIVWLNPLLGWKDYAPVARGMRAALPFIDLFAACHTLEGLAALEGELARL